MEANRLLVVLLLIPLIGQGLESPYIPHENPSEVGETLSPLWLLHWYGDILQLMAMENYSEALKLIEECGRLYIPSDLRYLFERFNELLLRLDEELNETDALLTEAYNLMETYRLEKLREKLEEASISLGRANITLIELMEALDELSRRIGVYSAPPGSEIRIYYERLRGLIDEIREIWRRYLELLKEVAGESSLLVGEAILPEIIEEETLPTLRSTSLSLYLNQTHVFVGRFVEAYGLLESEGNPLPNRTIQILLEDRIISRSETNSSGWFSIRFRVPYIYVDKLRCRAVFIPIGEDVGIYSANESDVVEINLIFYRVSVDVSHSNEGYPGRLFNITGRVSTEEGVGVSSLDVAAYLAGVKSTARSGDDGRFNLSLQIPEDTAVGSYILTIESQPSDVYAPGKYSASIDVTRAKLSLEVEAPRYLILPGVLRIEGRAFSKLALRRGLIHLHLKGYENSTEIRSDGSFTCNLRIPLLNIILGFYRLEVEVEPLEPWNSRASWRSSILLVNPLNLSLTLTFSMALIYLTPKRLRIRRRIGREVKAPIGAIEEGEGEVPPPKMVIEETLDPVLMAYLKALEAVIEATGLTPHPSETMREFWMRSAPYLDARSEVFLELTRIAEVALYSRTGPSEDEVKRAVELADFLMGEAP